MSERPKKLWKRVTILVVLLMAILASATTPSLMPSSVSHAQVSSGCDLSRGRYSEVISETENFVVIRSCGSSVGDFIYVYDKVTREYYFTEGEVR